MIPAVVHRDEIAFEHQVPTPSRSEVLARYRHLRAIGERHHADVMKFLSRDAIMHQARRLGLADGQTLILDSMEEMTLAFDLAIFTAPVGRSRAIDRYARSAQVAPGSDEALVLEAMGKARFAVVSAERRHEAAGWIVMDLFRSVELWLVDEGLENSLVEGAVFATRYYTLDRFSMTAGIVIPVDRSLLIATVRSTPQLLRKSHAEAVEDRRFAEGLYRTAIADGAMEDVTYQDPPGTDDAS